MARIEYTAEMQRYLSEIIPGHTLREISKMFLEKFDIELSIEQIRAYKKNRHIRSGTRGRMDLDDPRRKYPVEMESYVREIAQGRPSHEICEMVNERFGAGTITLNGLRAYKKNHGITSGLTGRFEKGHESPTKGRKMAEMSTPEAMARSARTQFKKGDIPHNLKPLGTIIENNGYLWVKVSMTGNQKERWRQLHREIWTQHNGPIPEGYNITFLDGNHKNCDISNLAIVSMAEQGALLRSGYRSDDPERTKVGINLAKLRLAVRDKRKSGVNGS